MAAGDDAAALAASLAGAEDTMAPEGTPGESASAGACNHALRATAEPIFATLADAEDASFSFLEDLVDDIFAGMRVAEENERALRAAVGYAWTQALGGARVGAAQAPASVDADGNETQDPNARLAQFLRPRIHEDDADADHKQHTVRKLHQRPLNRPGQPVVPFLAALWALVDHHAAFVEAQLARFASARFRVSSVPTLGRAGDWEIPVTDLAPFLRGVVRVARLSVLGSAAEYVVAANAPLLERKRNAQGALQLSHIALCVQAALLRAEAEEEKQQLGDVLTITPSGVFQTEVAGDGTSDGHEELLVYYDEGADPAPLAIDRSATGTVALKAELGAPVVKRQRMAKSIVSLMQRRESGPSKWGAIRKRLVVRDHHVGVAVETDMELNATAPPSLQRTPTMAAAKLLAGAGTPSPKKKASVAASTPRGALMAATSPSKHFREPDAATLANIFSLGTPRQLSPEELARRNDILSILEREKALATRKMAVALITAVSLPPPCVGSDGKPIVSEHDQAFQAYVAAYSSVTTTGGSCVAPTALGGSPDKAAVTSSIGKSGEPKRPRPIGGAHGKTRFELALEPPRYEVAAGNSHIRMAAEAAAAAEAMGKKSRTRGGVRSPPYAPSPPDSPVRKHIQPSSPPQQPHSPTTHNPRPLETASGHLPQLDTSRLAVGVKAVVRGIEKRGPRHDPSRNSRLRMHNYASSPGGEHDEPAVDGAPARVSPEKREHLPPVSPVKASPHRKHKHVTFPVEPADSKALSPQRPAVPLEELSPMPPSGSRRFPAKQSTFEKRASPPRVRNRVLTENANNSSSKKLYARAKWAERNASDDLAAMHAPRRNLAHHETMADY